MKLGYYAHYPSLLEPGPGPWGGHEIHNLHPVEAWKRILPWLKSKDIDYLITVVTPKYRDSIMHDWPFHYLCDFPRYPEARVFPAEVVRMNRRIVGEILAEATRLELDLFFSHFSFYAPRGFVEKRPRLLENYRRSRNQLIGHDTPDNLGALWGNVCWPDPEYQAFLSACYAEVFGHFPGIAGFMTAAGEHNLDPSPRSVGTVLAKEAKKQSKQAMLLDFLHFFVKEMDRHGKQSLVRTWYLPETDHHRLPKPTAFVQKYHVFDCMDAGMDERNKLLWACGTPCYQSFAQNGENAAQLIWFSPAYWKRIGQDLRDKQSPGAWIHDNTDWGNNGMGTPMQAWNLEAFLHYVRHPDDDPRLLWIERAGELFGPEQAGMILDALEKISHFVLNISKIIYFWGEGYTWNGPCPVDEQFHPDPFAVLGEPSYTPPDWVRGDVALLASYLAWVRKNPWAGFEAVRAAVVKTGERCAFGVLETSHRLAREAAGTLAEAEGRLPAAARGHAHALRVSAEVACAHADCLLNLCHARLRIVAMREGPHDAGLRADLGWEAVRFHGAALKALRAQVGWLNAYPHDWMDFGRWLRLSRPLFSSYLSAQWTPVDVTEIEHENLLWFVRELEPGRDDSATDPAQTYPSLTGRPLPPSPPKGFQMEIRS